MIYNNIFSLTTLLQRPSAYAVMHGGNEYPFITGVVNFYETHYHTGLTVEVELSNLPNTPDFAPRFLGLHIHESGDCSQDFTNTGMHYNPTGAEHPYHLGDLPPVLNSNGYAFLVVYDAFLSLSDVVGRSVILHDNRDDFTTQPSGASGNKIACGVIKAST